MTVITDDPRIREEIVFEGEARPVVTVRRAASFVTAPVRVPWGWWVALDAPERIMYRGLVLLAIGFAIAGWWPAALIVPGIVHVLVALGFSFQPVRSDGDG